MATPEGPRGQCNLGACSNPQLDALTLAIQSETDSTKRTAVVPEALALQRDDIGHLRLHQQTLAWAMRSQVQAHQRADNFIFFKWVTLR